MCYKKELRTTLFKDYQQKEDNHWCMTPSLNPLAEIKSTQQQEKAMKAQLEKGFVEYYFVMTDFKNSNAKEITEKLLA